MGARGGLRAMRIPPLRRITLSSCSWKDVLIHILEGTIASLKRNRLPEGIEDPADTAEIAAALEEREGLLEWVRNYPGDPKNIYVGLYIASEFEPPAA